MNWLTQKTGIIDHHRETDFGTQPIRVLHWMIVYMFNNTHPDFFQNLQNLIKEGKFNSQLDFQFGEIPIMIDRTKYRTPYANGKSKQIAIHETFLSYLWCITYALYVTYLEEIDYPKINKLNNRTIYPISKENIEKAKEMFDYAKLLIVDFVPWNKEEQPNPERFLAEERTYIEQVNCFYTEAVKFIFCHELVHLDLHLEKISEDTPDSHYLEFEIEADNKAIENIKKGISNSSSPFEIAKKSVVTVGTLIGVLSMFFFKATTEGRQHPNSEDRLTNVLEKFELDEQDEAWAIACVGLKFWDSQFGHNFEWSENPKSYKHEYFEIISQIKNRS